MGERIRCIVIYPAVGRESIHGGRTRGRVGPRQCSFVLRGRWRHQPRHSARRGASGMQVAWAIEPIRVSELVSVVREGEQREIEVQVPVGRSCECRTVELGT